MGKEIERKFLVKSMDFKKEATNSFVIRQGYISRTPERTVRVRIAGASAYLTIKGKSSDSGLTRYEWEKEIPLAEAQELMNICEPGIIDKTRYVIPTAGVSDLDVGRDFEVSDGLKFEVDEFHGHHEGLIIAEIELEQEDQEFAKPSWLGKEVTGNPKYYNAYLSQN